LPADFETFGQAVATSMADLLGGTTGQVLSKASNTDMDFTWVTSDDTNAIQNAIVDAKGDLIAASAADTPARLAVGNNGETLVADSSATTGLRWTGTPSASNPVLNSAFQCWQRGTSVSVSANVLVYTADRWQVYNGPNQAMTVSRQSTNDTTNLPFIQYAARVQRNSGQTGTTETFLSQPLETLNSIPFVGKTVTISFYARAGANFSPTSSNLKVNLVSGTGTDQNITTYTGGASVATVTNSLTTTWTRYSVSGTVGATATELRTDFAWVPTGTAGANDWFEITGVQLDIGSVALPFRTYAATIQGELSACQRYYYRAGGNALFETLAIGRASSTANIQVYFQVPVPLRTNPNLLDYSNLIGSVNASASFTLTSANVNQGSKNLIDLSTVFTGASFTNGGLGQIQTNNSLSAYLAVGAEL
jgi:hypothetical protein